MKASPEEEVKETQEFGDMSEFKKSVKSSINKRALEREMPDESILEKVRQSGINEAMREYVPAKGTTVVRTKEDARRVIKILKQYPNRIHAWDTETIGVEVRT
jgi:hypothetical protein